VLRIGQLKCVSNDVVCGMFCCVDNEKTLINEDDRQDRELRVELCKLVVKTHHGHFWNDFSPSFMHATLIILCI
jgi:hypothetical protein